MNIIEFMPHLTIIGIFLALIIMILNFISKHKQKRNKELEDFWNHWL